MYLQVTADSLQWALLVLVEQEDGASVLVNADCMQLQPADMLPLGQDVPLFFGQLNSGFVAPQTVDSRLSHLPKLNEQESVHKL